MNNFKIIDMENWARKDCFNHFMNIAKSTYSLTVNVDISNLMKFIKKNNYRLYPVFTWIISRAINNTKEFKMGFNKEGQVGYFNEISPDYSVIDDKTKIMDSLCTPYNTSFKVFYKNMVEDLNNYKEKGIKPNNKCDFFLVSCIPWMSYTSFDVNNQSEFQFLFPMITWGKYFELNNKILMPLTLQIHHAAADGYHCSLFYNDVEKILKKPEEYLEY